MTSQIIRTTFTANNRFFTCSTVYSATDFGVNKFETMLFSSIDPDDLGDEVESFRTAEMDKAAKIHDRIVNKWTTALGVTDIKTSNEGCFDLMRTLDLNEFLALLS